MKLCRHRRRDDRHRVAGLRQLPETLPGATSTVTRCRCLKDSQDSMPAASINRAYGPVEDPALTDRRPGLDWQLTEDCHKSRIGNLRPSAIS